MHHSRSSCLRPIPWQSYTRCRCNNSSSSSSSTRNVDAVGLYVPTVQTVTTDHHASAHHLVEYCIRPMSVYTQLMHLRATADICHLPWHAKPACVNRVAMMILSILFPVGFVPIYRRTRKFANFNMRINADIVI